MASADAGDGDVEGATVIEVDDSPADAAEDEISPLLAEVGSGSSRRDRPNRKMNIFSVSYPRKRSPNRENSDESSVGKAEAEADVLNQVVSWVWNGSRYSGFLCVASSCLFYFLMEILTVASPVSSIPLFQKLSARCTIILLLSFLWLRKSGKPLIVPTHVRNLLLLRSFTGLISVMSFIYSVQSLPLSLAIMLNFGTPILASIAAKVILQEKTEIQFSGGLACSFLGVLLIFLPPLIDRGHLDKNGDVSTSSQGEGHPIFTILVGIFSSLMGGISYCLIRTGAKASDHPVYTVLSFGLLATPVSAICTFAFQAFVFPSASTFFLMVVQGVLAFFAEICLARGLQIENVSRATNILFIKVILLQVRSMIFLEATAIGNLIGCLLIVASMFSTLYFGREKETQ